MRGFQQGKKDSEHLQDSMWHISHYSGVQTEPGLSLFAAVPRKLGPGDARWGTRLRFAQDKRAAVSSGKRHGATQLQKQSPQTSTGTKEGSTFPQKPRDAELLHCGCQPRKAACPC